METLKYFLLFLVVMLPANYLLKASDSISSNSFKPHGSPFVKIFSNVHTDIDGQSTAFDVNRAYLGYQYELSPNFSSKLTLDVGSPEVEINDSTEVSTSLQMTAYLKTASLTYENNGFEASFGLIGLKQHKLEEKYWGHRYIFKTFQDEHGISTSADLGLWITYEITDFLELDAVMRNGEGYKRLQADDKYLYGGAFTLQPIEGLVIRGYYDYSKSNNTQTTIAHFLGYKINNVTLGASYNIQNNQDYVSDNHLSGYSLFGSYDINKLWEVFARYDRVEFEDLSGINADQWIAGLQVSPVDGLKMALNYQGWFNDTDFVDNQHYLYLNCQVAF